MSARGDECVQFILIRVDVCVRLCVCVCSNISCLSGDDGSTCIPITSNNVEIVASQDSSINSKARGSNKVRRPQSSADL